MSAVRTDAKADAVPLESFACTNSQCPDFTLRGGANVSIYSRYGRKQVRLFRCATCDTTFSELKGTLFWDSRIDWETIEKIYRSLLDGRGIRATARMHNLSKNTIKRYIRLARQDTPTVEKFLVERGALTAISSNQLRDAVHRHAPHRSAGQSSGLTSGTATATLV